MVAIKTFKKIKIWGWITTIFKLFHLPQLHISYRYEDKSWINRNKSISPSNLLVGTKLLSFVISSSSIIAISLTCTGRAGWLNHRNQCFDYVALVLVIQEVLTCIFYLQGHPCKFWHIWRIWGEGGEGQMSDGVDSWVISD